MRDERKGVFHDAIPKLDEWRSAEARYLAQLPDEAPRRQTIAERTKSRAGLRRR